MATKFEDTLSEIMNEVREAEKTASIEKVASVNKVELETEVGKALQKVASDLRDFSKGSKVSYRDLYSFWGSL